uniref:Orf63 n=1 Tax=Lactococcus phage phi31.1 TaxID=117830 RepID=Q9MCG0_9CAUD|nr:Orf63 [Lactococcus phage phi31.1]
MTKFEEKKKEAYEKASIKHFGNADGSRAMRYLLNELEKCRFIKRTEALPVVPEFVGSGWIVII